MRFPVPVLPDNTPLTRSIFSDERLSPAAGAAMVLLKLAGISSAFVLALSLSSCSRGLPDAKQDSTTSAAPQRQAMQILYVARPQTVSTYTVNSNDGSMELISTVQVASSFSSFSGTVRVFPSLSDRFLDVAWWDSASAQHISVFATDSHGAPQLPAIQTVDLPALAEVTVPATGKFAFWEIPTFEPNTEVGSGTIHVLAIDADTGKLSETTAPINDPKYPFGNVTLYGTNSDGSILYTVGETSIDGFTSDSYLQHKMDSHTGTLGLGSAVYGVEHSWGSVSLTTLGAKYAATFFNPFEERIPAITHIDVTSLQDRSQSFSCNNDMSDACLNAENLQFDVSGDFLFVTDVVSKRMRVLHVDAGAKTLHDTGSSFPLTATAGVYFSPDDKLVYSVADASAQVQVHKFDPSSGTLTPIGTPQSFPVPYALVPALRN